MDLEKLKTQLLTQEPKLKLYVWDEVFEDYTYGVGFALAENPEEARKLIFEKLGYVDNDLDKEPKEITTKEGFYVLGGG